jgi:hypothetical protein
MDKVELIRCEKIGIAARIDRLKPILPLQTKDLLWWGRRFRLPLEIGHLAILSPHDFSLDKFGKVV